MQNVDLWKARVKAFVFEIGGLLLTSILGIIFSDGFRETLTGLVSEHFGTTAAATLLTLVVTGGLKHLRNVSVINKYHRLGVGSGAGVEKPHLI